MLTRLSVSNFAIIDKIDLQFDKGLTIITGETGAGKSILLGALKLILGERANLQLLNDTERKGVIEAKFNISKLKLNEFFVNNDLDYEDQSILRRELLPSGKSRAFINDTPVNLNVLKELGEKLIDIHSQFETAGLLDADYQMQILDACAIQLQEVENYGILFNERSAKLLKLQKLKNKLTELSKESDYNRFLFEELKNADLQPDEVSILENELNELKNVEDIQQVLGETAGKLDEPEYGILAVLNETTRSLQKFTSFGEDFESFKNRIESSMIELDDVKKEIERKLESLEANPEKLQETEERLNLIHLLLQKHKALTVEELLIIQNNLGEGESDFMNLETSIKKTENEIIGLEEKMNGKAKEISKKRKEIAPSVEKELLELLSKLGMKDASLKFELISKNEFGLTGTDEVQLLFSANKGVQLKPVQEAISGGERSRLMLAVKRILAGKLELATLILDEIDTGVSGRVADEVGEMMKDMSKDLQLLSITHLPQVAAKADRHLKVLKTVKEGQTLTEVSELSDEERINEIAGLISGSDVTDTAIQQARLLTGL